MSKDHKLKRAVIREELVALTGDYIAAIVLNQFLYWSERRRDFDKFIREEQERDPAAKMALTHGWIYKSTEELRGEIMVTVSDSTVRRRIKELVEKGWLHERRNPRLKWDRTLQYRPDIYRIQRDLWELGYPLEGYPLQYPESAFLSDECNLHGEESKQRSEQSKQPSDGTVPETTSETPSEVTSKTPFPPSPEAHRIAAQSKQMAAQDPKEVLDGFERPPWAKDSNENKPRQRHPDPVGEARESYEKWLAKDKVTPAMAWAEAFMRDEGTELSEKKREKLVAHFDRILDNCEGATKEQAVLAWRAWRKKYDWKDGCNPYYESFEEEYALILGQVKAGTITTTSQTAKSPTNPWFASGTERDFTAMRLAKEREEAI